MREVLAVDIGGTFIKWAIINYEFKVIKKDRFKTPTIYEELIKSLQAIRKLCNVEGVSISIPAGYDFVNDRAFAPNLTILNDRQLYKDLSKKLDKNIIIENDGNLAALGEYHIVEKCGINNMVLLTLGTGVGGGAIINGRLLSSFSTAFEVGHIIAKEGGSLCGCGRNGCLDEYGSSVGVTDIFYKLSGRKVTPVMIAKLYDEKNSNAIECFNIYADILARSIADIANLLTPDKVKLGGGLSELSRYFFHRLNIKFNENIFPLYKGRVKLEVAELKNSAGVFGAAVNFFYNR